MKPSELSYASLWLRIRSVVIVAVLAAATIHTGHARSAQIAQQEILTGAWSQTAPWTNPSHVPGLSQPDTRTKVRIAEGYGRQPLGFESNQGQTSPDVKFVARGAGYTLFLTSTEAVLALRRASASASLHMKLVGSNPAPQVSPRDELPGQSNYIIGNDRRNWRTHVPRYAKVEYQEVYPGIDLLYYGNQGQLEFDFVVAPGADPGVIELAFEGARDIRLGDGGDLHLDTGEGEVRLEAPLIYQETDGRRAQIPGGYRKTGRDRVAFHVGEYDATRPLVVDPIVVYSTYLGGSNQDFALGIAVDPDGNAFITGLTSSLDFPMSSPAQPACATNIGDGYPDCADVFITMLTQLGGSVGYSTYLGGTSRDIGTAVAVDNMTRAVYVTGLTDSRDFPTVNAIEPTFGDNPEATTRAFVVKLDGKGSLAYSTYLGGEELSVVANAIAVDSEGAAYVTGAAGSPYDQLGNAFVTKLTPDGSAVAYSARLGGPAVGYGIAIDAQGYASVTGATYSPDFRVNVPQPTSGRGFAAKLLPDGSALVYSTYLRGDGIGTGIAVAGPYTYVTGVLPGNHTPWPTPGGPGGGPTDAFVAILDFGGHGGNFTFGGTGEDRGSAIAVGPTGDIWVTGVTTSTDFPLVNPLQGQVRDLDAFVVRFGPGLVPVFSTYLGGSGHEQLDNSIGTLPGAPGPALAVYYGPLCGQVSTRCAFVAGFTDSVDFPTAGHVPAVQPTTHGIVNSFVAMIYDDGIPTKPDLMVTEIGGTPAEAELGATLGYLLRVTNKGPAPATDVTFLDQLPPGVIVDQVVIGTPPSTTPSPRHCAHDVRQYPHSDVLTFVFCSLGTLSVGESVEVAITVMPTSVGAQINTAAVVQGVAQSLPEAFFNWYYGFTQDLIWGDDAGRDGNINDNSVTTTTVMTPGSADLSVTGSASSDLVMLDGTLTYTLDIENHGPALTAATLIDTLPAGATLISAAQTGSTGTCTGTSVITCQWPSLSGVARVAIIVRATAPGTLTNSAVVSGTASDPDSANNAVTFVTSVNRAPIANAGPDQIVSAGGSCQALVTLNGTASTDLDGDTLTYTWTAENLMPPPIVLSLPGPSGGTVTGSAPTVPVPPGTYTITLTVNDGHGGTASDTVVITVRDVTAPTFSGVPAPMSIEQSNQSGAPFTVAMPTAADNCGGSVAVSSNAPAIFPPGSTVVTFTAHDSAGNSATSTTMITVVDTVAPTLAIASPQTRDYAHSDVVTATFSATDAGSGLAAGMPTAALDGAAVANGQGISMLTLALGTHSFVVSATDAAGNSQSQTVTFTLIATLDSLIASVDVFAGQQKVDGSNTVKSLLAKLNDAKQAAGRGNNTAAINKLQEFIDLLRAQSGRHITPDAAQILVADAQYVISTLR